MQKIQVQAIETMYKGIRYRSRHEARWAVFMTELGLSFVYEAEGYKLKAGWYLPDFWLPHLNALIEIKPHGFMSYESSTSKPWSKAYETLQRQGDELAEITEARVLCIGGNPYFTEDGVARPWGYPWDYEAVLLGPYWDAPFFWCECPLCNCIDIAFEGRADRNYNHRISCAVIDKTRNADSERLVLASLVAMNTRFENL